MGKKTYLRWSAFVVGCGCIGWAYAMNAFAIYGTDLKETFDYTQTQLEIIYGAAHLGFVTAWPAGKLFQVKGPQVTTSLGLLAALAYLLQWTATFSVPWYSDKGYLFAIYSFTAGCGSGFMYVAATSVNLKNFQPEHWGLVNGILQGAASFGPLVLIVTYHLWCAPAKTHQSSRTAIAQYFAFMAVSYVVWNCLAILVYGNHAADIKEAENDRKKVIDPPDPVKIVREENLLINKPDGEEDGVENMCCSFFRNKYFIFVFIPFVFLFATEAVFTGNISSMLESFHLQRFVLVGTVLSPMFGTFGKPMLGFMSDAIMPCISRVWIILVLALLSGLLYILATFLGDNIGVLLTAMLMANFACYSIKVIGPLMLMDIVGLHRFPTAFGTCVVGYCIAAFTFAIILGVSYDLQIPDLSETTTCYKLSCFSPFYLMSSFTALLSAALCVPLILAYRSGTIVSKGDWSVYAVE